MKEFMNKRERLAAVLNGVAPDRPPVSTWRHFTDAEHQGPKPLSEKLLEFQKQYDWDFMKINPRAVYYHEAWGNVYDYAKYNDVIPTRIKTLVERLEDLDKIQPVSGTQGVFAEQLELVKILVDAVGKDCPLFMTVFTPIGILLNLCGMRSLGRYREAEREGSPVIHMIQENGEQVHKALGIIADTIAEYCAALTKEGVDGVFYAALGMARTGYFTQAEWEEFVKPYDVQVLKALRPAKTILHTCGVYSNPEWFLDFPVDVLHWAESATGNPSLTGSDRWLNGVVPMGGVDERLFGQNKPDEIKSLAIQSIHKMAGKPYILAPDCSVSINTLDSEYRAFRASVDEA